MKTRPPHIVLRFLRWFCKEEFIEEIEGDLIELFDNQRANSLRKARWNFTWDVIRSIRWINLKKPSIFSNRTIMFRNYLKIGYRNLTKDFNFAIINLLGLSLGLAAFIIMIMMLHHEFTFDQFHTKGDRIFEVIQEFQNIDGADPEIFTSLVLSKALREEMPIVENAVTIHGAASTWMEVEGARFFEEEGIVAGPEFFEIFDFQLKYGDKNQVLKNPRSIVLEEQLAQKLFGTDNPIGQIIDIERYGLFTVSGVLKTLPTNSFIQFNFVLTQDYDVFFTHVAPWFPSWFQSWKGDPAATFVLLNDAKEAINFPQQIKPILQKHLGDEEAINPHYLLNLYDLHFGLNGIDGRVNDYIKGDIKQVQLFVLIAFLVLAMACFNYINLTTARSIKRTKEVGIRKSIGALKGQISSQFLTESFLQVLFAFILSLGWMYGLLSYVNSITGINLSFSWENSLTLLPYVLLTLMIVSLLAGFYPALFLSRFSPVEVLKNTTISVRGNSILRNGLVTLQYSLVIMMLVSLLIVHDQYEFMNNKKLGFDTEQLVVVEVNGAGVRNNYLNLKQELMSYPNISNVSGLTRMIGGYRSAVGVHALDQENSEQKHGMRFYGMDEDGLRTLELTLKKGEQFQGISSLDSTSILLNESAAKLYGGDQILGQQITLVDEEDEDFQFSAQVIGIVEDFHYGSLHDPIGPVVIGYYLNPFESLDDIVIRVAENEIPQTIAFIESVHNKFDENNIMTWEFMDDMVQRAYEREMVFRNVFLGASFISLFIALLGIIGLISYNLVAKTKEFGIRKVLGANYWQLLSIQSKGFIRFILIAIFIATPISWWFATNWLLNYAYRIALSPIHFLIAFGVILGCTTITLWVINHHAARKNPVEALRYE